MVEIIDREEMESRLDMDNFPEPYRSFRDDQGIPVHTGLAIEDVNDLETAYWDRTGQNGAFVNLWGANGTNDLHVHELEPGGETTWQRHVHDEIVFISEGSGTTVLEHDGEQRTFEWSQDSLFFIPNNVDYKYVNLSGEETARVVAQTSLPLLMNFIPHDDFFYGAEFDFWDDTDLYSTEGTLQEDDYVFPAKWTANFIPDVKKFDELELWELRGAGGKSVRFPMEHSSMWSHISEFPVGTYKKAHRHDPGANVILLSGRGYSLIGPGHYDEWAKLDWKPYSIFVPPARWYHQHFNVGDEPARYLANHAPRLGTLSETDVFDSHRPINYIEYTEEDPAIRELFDAELEKRGLDSDMPDECYTDPDYEFGE